MSKLVGFADNNRITPKGMLHTGEKESCLFGLVDGIPPPIAHIFFLDPAGLHSSDKLRPV